MCYCGAYMFDLNKNFNSVGSVVFLSRHVTGCPADLIHAMSLLVSHE